MTTTTARVRDLIAAVELTIGTDDPAAVTAHASGMDFYDWQALAYDYGLPATAIDYNEAVKHLEARA
jgi:hypothetical protein